MSEYISTQNSLEYGYKRVEDYIRSMIQNNTWPIGTKLPSGKTLADTLGTSIFTIQTAMQHLCREGLIERKPRIGTHVRGGTVQLTCAGIYFGRDFWRDPEDASNCVLSMELQKQWEERGIQTRIWIDDRPATKQTTPFPPLLAALKRREVQALLATSIKPHSLSWLKDFKVPLTITMASMNVPQQVAFNWSQIMKGAVELLRMQGCRSVGMICSCPMERSRSKRSADPNNDYYHAFLDEVHRSGLTIRDEWIRMPLPGTWSGRHEDYGYQQFEELWNQRSRPDGLWIYPDWAVRGVMTRILARQIGIPRELKLALSQVDQLPYICPFPAGHVVFQIPVLARAMIEHIYRQIRGKPAERTLCSVLIEPPVIPN